ncbi:MAG: hypothetical protein QXK35_04260 [Nitrososphaerales archaeon]
MNLWFMDWRAVDERLRSELLLSLDFLESYDTELMDLNNGKVIIPSRLPVGILSSSWLYVIFSSYLTGKLCG